jgi:predicted RNase H-like nuclease (RuvC/YqgF family)
MSEELLQQLIHMVAENNKIVKELKEELREFKEEMYEFKQEMLGFKAEMISFREETNRRFDHVDRHLRLLESDFDLMHRRTSDHEREISRIKHLLEQ